MHECEGMTERHQDAVGHQISGKFSDSDTTKWIFSSTYSHNKKEKQPSIISLSVLFS